MNMAKIEERADDAATMCVWCEQRVQGACKSHYDTLTCTHRVIVPTAVEWDSAIEARAAERNEGKSNAAHWHQRATEAEAEVAQARQTAEYWKAEHLAGNTRIGELHDEVGRLAKQRDDYRHGMTVQMEAVASMVDLLHRMLESPTTQISVTWKDAVRQALALGPNAELTGRQRLHGACK